MRTPRTAWTPRSRDAVPAPSAGPGLYNVKLTVNGREYTKPVLVLDDVWLHER